MSYQKISSYLPTKTDCDLYVELIKNTNCELCFAGKKYRRPNKIGKQKEVDFSDSCQQRTKTLKKGVNWFFVLENFFFSFKRCPTYLIFQLL